MFFPCNTARLTHMSLTGGNFNPALAGHTDSSRYKCIVYHRSNISSSSVVNELEIYAVNEKLYNILGK